MYMGNDWKKARGVYYTLVLGVKSVCHEAKYNILTVRLGLSWHGRGSEDLGLHRVG